MSSAWGSLEEVRGLAAVAAEWVRHTGHAFDALRQGMLLQKAGRKASSYPCPHKFGCTHQVKPRGSGFVGICKDDDGTGCGDLLLTAEEVVVWELNFVRLGREVARALKCEPKDAKLGLTRTWQIGSLGDAPLPIVLTIQHDADGLGEVVAQLVARFPKGFILLAPTSRFCTAAATELLGKVNAGFFSLESHLTLLTSGKLHAPKSGAELFKGHLPEQKEPLREAESARVFRLFGELLAMGTKLTAPPARVFDLMVFKKMSRAETALACKCVASVITKRVALIEGHFRMPIEKLCDFASDLKERQRTVKGDKYAKKKHGALPDEPAQYDDCDKPGPREDENGCLPEEKPDYN
jgi:hypothetical protein